MFRKKRSWYSVAIKALLFTGGIYKVSGMFMKSTAEKKKRKKKDASAPDCINDFRKILLALRATRHTP